MRLEGELFEVKRGMFYACLACVEGYKGSDGFIVIYGKRGFQPTAGGLLRKGFLIQ